MNATTTAPSELKELIQKIERYERTLVTLKNNNLQEVRLMFGTVAMTTICDEIYPIAELKRDYMRTIKYRIIELKNRLLEITAI